MTTQIAVNSGVTYVTVEVIDVCAVKSMTGSKAWASDAATRSAALRDDAGDGTNQHPGFVLNGTVGFINDAIATALEGGDTGDNIRNNHSVTGITTTVGTAHYAPFDYSTVANATGTGAAVRRRGALANIFEMYASLPEKRSLTWDEMQEAIKRGTVWDSTVNDGAGGWTNGFTGTYAP